MERNHNIDIVRAVALILVLIYHCWVKIGSVPIGNEVFQIVIRLGGEIGVTAFFVLSGYGIYQSLYRTEKTGEIHFFSFMKKRLQRILPQYYLNIFVALILTGSAVYFGKMHVWNIVAHFFLVHNLVPSFAGAVNGVLWTMGVTFQFYLIAIPLYKILNKVGGILIPLGILFTISCKIVAFHYILSDFIGTDAYSVYSFWIGRNLIFTDLDNFLIGMGVAFFSQKHKTISKRWMAVTGCVLSVIMLYLVCKIGVICGIHTDNWSGYLWHSGVALCIGFIMLFAYYIGETNRNIVSRGLLWLSKYEYGIYLWHLLIIDNLLQHSPMIQEMMGNGKHVIVGTIFIIVSIVAGVVFTKLTEQIKIGFLSTKRV